MGKRKTDKLLSPSEIRQSAQHHYDGYIKADKRSKARRPETQIETGQMPVNSRIRPCWSCDCVNDKGFCDNYFLHAVLRNKCTLQVD